MNEHILPAALRLNESIPFGRVEPLHSSSSHYRLLAFSAGQVARATPRGACRDLENDLRAARTGKLSKADQKSSRRLLVRSPRTRVNAIRGLAPAKYRTQRVPVRVNSTRRGTDISRGSIGAVLRSSGLSFLIELQGTRHHGVLQRPAT